MSLLSMLFKKPVKKKLVPSIKKPIGKISRPLAPKPLAAAVEMKPLPDRVELLGDEKVRETHNSWYPKKTYAGTVKNPNGGGDYRGSFTTVGMITGCGVMQGYGISSFAHPSQPHMHRMFLEDILPQIQADIDNPETQYPASSKKRLAGAIFVTLGKSYWPSMHDTMVNVLGFELAGEYSNFQHDYSGNEKQRMYYIKLKPPKK